MRRLLFLVLLFSCIPCAIASARVFTPPGGMSPGEYKYVENGDGTYTEYYDGGGLSPIRGDTYSAEAMEEAARLDSEVVVDSGTTGQNATDVVGETPENAYGAEDVVKAIRGDTPETVGDNPYATPGEAEIGDDLIAEGVAEDTLPTFATVAAGLAGTVVTSGGVIAAGIGVGIGIDELLGIPAYEDVFGTSEATEGEVGVIRDGDWLAVFALHSEITIGELSSCYSPTFSLWLGGVEGELCEYPGLETLGLWDYEQYDYGTGKWEYHEGSCVNLHLGLNESLESDMPSVVGNWYEYSPSGTCSKYLVPDSCPTGTFVRCELEQTGRSSFLAQYYSTLSETFSYAAYPAEGLKTDQSHIESPSSHTIAPLAPVPMITPPAPSTIPAPVRHKIIEKAKHKPNKKEHEEEEEGKKPVPGPAPLVKPIEEGEELPNPDNPVVPEPGHDELYTDYASKAEKEGFTNVQEKILPLEDADPKVGPEDVVASRINPMPGTSADPGTEIEVGTNPADAPPPEGGHVPIGGPTLPGFDHPDFGVLCIGFPFGVPCWLVKTIEGWSTTKEAPKWGISSFTVEGHTIPGATVDLAKLEPIMEVLRPAMLVFATIGLVLLFYRFAKGGSPASGGGSDASSGGSSDEGEN